MNNLGSFNPFEGAKSEEFDRPRNRILVGLNKWESIEVPPESPDKKIYTFGVDGCTVTAVYVENSDGTRDGTVTHFEPSFVRENVDALSFPKGTEHAKAEAVLFVNYDLDDKFEPAQSVEMKTKSVDILKAHLQNILGDDIKISVVPYKISTKVNEERQIDLIIRSKKANGNSNSELKWWEGSIQL